MAEIRGKGSRRKPCPRTPKGKAKTEVEVIKKRIAKAERRIAKTNPLHEWIVKKLLEVRLRELSAPQAVVAPSA